MLDMNTIQTLNKDPKSLDLHNVALANLKQAKVKVGAIHDMIGDRFRTKSVGNFDDAFKKLNELRKSGVLDIYNKKMNIKENTEIVNENVVAGPSSAPLASFGGTGFQIRYKTPGSEQKKILVPKLPTHKKD